MRMYQVFLVCMVLVGCAEGRIDILDNSGKVVGNCSADFKFHFRGAQDSVNYILYICAKEHIEKGFRISDESILGNDYSLPNPPNRESWNSKVAKKQHTDGFISEEKLGYLLAYLEFQYWEDLKEAEAMLARSEITEYQYTQIVKDAKRKFKGT